MLIGNDPTSAGCVVAFGSIYRPVGNRAPLGASPTSTGFDDDAHPPTHAPATTNHNNPFQNPAHPPSREYPDRFGHAPLKIAWLFMVPSSLIDDRPIARISLPRVTGPV
jgi:hypothetical protein